jgi:hypothetical protein
VRGCGIFEIDGIVFGSKGIVRSPPRLHEAREFPRAVFGSPAEHKVLEEVGDTGNAELLVQ